MRLDTDRLSLRRLELDDAGFMLRLLNEPSFLQNIGDRGVRTLDDARANLERGPLDSYHRHGFGIYMVETRADGVAVGVSGVLRRDGLDDPDLGFAFLPEFWGRGYAREAGERVLAHARDDLGLTRIVAITSPDNTGSIAVLQRLGFAFERMLELSPGAGEVRLSGRSLTPKAL